MNAFLPIQTPAITRLDGEWILAVQGEAAARRHLQHLIEGLIPVWIATGDRGGYPAERTAPGRSGLRQRPLPAELQGRADALLDARAIDIRAIQVLRSALLAQVARALIPEAAEDERIPGLEAIFDTISLKLLPYHNMAVKLFTLPGADISSDAEEAELYPDWSNELSFALNIEEPPDSKMRRCVVDFGQPVNRECLQRLADWIEPWAELLRLGSFEQPWDAPGMRYCTFGTVQVFAANSAEIVVDRFDAAEAAWNVLFNLLARFAQDYPILTIELD